MKSTRFTSAIFLALVLSGVILFFDWVTYKQAIVFCGGIVIIIVVIDDVCVEIQHGIQKNRQMLEQIQKKLGIEEEKAK